MSIISMQKKLVFTLFFFLIPHFCSAMEKNTECTNDDLIEISAISENYKISMGFLDNMAKYSESELKTLLECTKKSFHMAMEDRIREPKNPCLEYGIFMSINFASFSNDYIQITSDLLVKFLKTKSEWGIYYNQLIPLLLNKNNNTTDLFNEVCYKSTDAYTWFDNYAYNLAKEGKNSIYLEIIDEIFNNFGHYYKTKEKEIKTNFPDKLLLPNLEEIKKDQTGTFINQVTISHPILNANNEALTIIESYDRGKSYLSMTNGHHTIPMFQEHNENLIIISEETYPVAPESKTKQDYISSPKKEEKNADDITLKPIPIETRKNIISEPPCTRIYRDLLIYYIYNSSKDDLLDISLSPLLMTRVLCELGPENENIIHQWYIYYKTLYTSHATKPYINLKIDLNSSNGLSGKKRWYKRECNKKKFYLFIFYCDLDLRRRIAELNKILDGKLITI